MSADHSATACTATTPTSLEETKGVPISQTSRQKQTLTAHQVPKIKAPNKIAKPPRKAVGKGSKADVAQRKATQSARKQKQGKQTDSSQKQERSDAPSKQETKTHAQEDDAFTAKYYMNFDFYFKRTSFRTMTLYFKTAFKSYFEAWKAQRQREPVSECLARFCHEEFPGLLESLKEAQRHEFIGLLKLLVFSHRHNKNDAFL